MAEWWGFLVFPLFLCFFVYIIGKQFNVWSKVQGFLDSRKGGSLDFGSMLKGLKGISFEGIGDLFRGWFT